MTFTSILTVFTMALGVFGSCRFASRQNSKRWVWLGMGIFIVVGGVLDLRFQYHAIQASHRAAPSPGLKHQ